MANPFDPNDRSPTLGSLIARQITESSSHKITFAEYMDMALYHPQYGYYARKAVKIGAEGDFFTAPHLGADFGELLAEQFVQMWEVLGCPDPFTLVEMGAGQGLLAADILRYLRQRYSDCFKVLEYTIVERAIALIAEQRQQLQVVREMGDRLRWCTLEAMPSESVVGCFFSNELVDALPVHQVVVADGQLQEVYVTLQSTDETEGQLGEVTDVLSTPALAEYFALTGINLLSERYPEGYRSEVNLAGLHWLTTVAGKLKRGYVLTIDYGYPSDRYYHPLRSEGTLQCYYQHAHHSDPYIHIGEQDITAHVDFTALQRQGEQVGLQTVGFTKQGLFLMALGLGQRLAQLGQSDSTDPSAIVAALRYRDALQQLIDPTGLGNFGVLIQGKAVDGTQPLKGLQQT